ncbi:hypothetical protein [Vibrio phage phiKT1028]|nr:hypothetical protein [Vibrio phage phiKT1028]
MVEEETMSAISNQTLKKLLKKVKAGETLDPNEQSAVYRHPLVGSTIRCNLLTEANYSPYCPVGEKCSMPRTHWNGEQFECPSCGWVSAFPDDFMELYKATHK